MLSPFASLRVNSAKHPCTSWRYNTEIRRFAQNDNFLLLSGNLSSRSGFQDTLHNLAARHLIETDLPARKLLHPADERGRVEAPGFEERDNFFPDRIIVAEAPLEPRGLADQRVERKTQRRVPPANFGNLAAGPHRLQRRLERR